MRRGTVNLHDLRRNVVAASRQPFHALTFTLPVHDSSENEANELKLGYARTALDDPVIRGLGAALLPSLEHPENACPMFVEHVLVALRAHLIHRFGAANIPRRRGLSRSQLERARAFLEAHLSESLSLSDLAASCSLSSAHFARSFQLAMGMPPHRFLVERRVKRAQELLLGTKLPLSDIALQCGFAGPKPSHKSVSSSARRDAG